MSRLRDEYVAAVSSVYDEVASRQSADGRFRDPTLGFSTLGQFSGCYFAYLYALDTPYRGSPDALDRAIRGWDYYSGLVTPEGRTRLVTFDHYWHDVNDGWGLYYWLTTMDLVGEHVEADRRAQWHATIDRMAAGIADHIRTTAATQPFADGLARHQVANLFVWATLALHRYGTLRADPESVALAEDVMARILRAQNESGSWLEGGGPVVLYAEVTACAVGLYAHHTGDPAAHQSALRCLDWVRTTRYADLARDSCIDGRNRGDAWTFHASPTYASTEAGSAFLTDWVRSLRAHQMDDLASRLQGLVAMTDWMAAIPSDTPPADRPFGDFQPAHEHHDSIGLDVTRHGDWTVTACWAPHVRADTRWIMERQNLLAVHHRGHGTLLGGGHSIAQPELSTFTVAHNGAMHYLPTDATVSRRGIEATYDGRDCAVDIDASADGVALHYRGGDGPDTQRVTAQLPIPVGTGRHVTLPDGTVLSDDVSVRIPLRAGARLGVDGASLTLSTESVLIYPIVAFDPYRQSQRDAKRDDFAVLAADLSETHLDVHIEPS